MCLLNSRMVAFSASMISSVGERDSRAVISSRRSRSSRSVRSALSRPERPISSALLEQVGFALRERDQLLEARLLQLVRAIGHCPQLGERPAQALLLRSADPLDQPFKPGSVLVQCRQSLLTELELAIRSRADLRRLGFDTSTDVFDRGPDRRRLLDQQLVQAALLGITDSLDQPFEIRALFAQRREPLATEFELTVRSRTDLRRLNFDAGTDIFDGVPDRRRLLDQSFELRALFSQRREPLAAELDLQVGPRAEIGRLRLDTGIDGLERGLDLAKLGGQATRGSVADGAEKLSQGVVRCLGQRLRTIGETLDSRVRAVRPLREAVAGTHDLRQLRRHRFGHGSVRRFGRRGSGLDPLADECRIVLSLEYAAEGFRLGLTET